MRKLIASFRGRGCYTAIAVAINPPASGAAKLGRWEGNRKRGPPAASLGVRSEQPPLHCHLRRRGGGRGGPSRKPSPWAGAGGENSARLPGINILLLTLSPLLESPLLANARRAGGVPDERPCPSVLRGAWAEPQERTESGG